MAGLVQLGNAMGVEVCVRTAVGRYAKEFENNREAAVQLLSIGESAPRDSIAAEELAAWTAVASVILNLDETVTRR